VRVVNNLTDFAAQEDYRTKTWQNFVSLATRGDDRGGDACFATIVHPQYEPPASS